MIAEQNVRMGSDMESFHYRRIFSDDYFWLTIDYSAERKVVNFYLIYRFGMVGMSCYRWLQGQGLKHYRVDGGDDSPFKNEAPILTDTPMEGLHEVIEKFKTAATQIDPEVTSMVLDELQAKAKAA